MNRFKCILVGLLNVLFFISCQDDEEVRDQEVGSMIEPNIEDLLVDRDTIQGLPQDTDTITNAETLEEIDTTTDSVEVSPDSTELEEPPFEMIGELDGYVLKETFGFNVYISEEALGIDSLLTSRTYDLVNDKLAEVFTLGIPIQIVEELKLTPIFMEWASNNGSAFYNPSTKENLIANGSIAEKSQSIEISNIKNFYDWTLLNQPYLVLHELSHAYHFRVLGLDQEDINQAYRNATLFNLYESVPYNGGNGNISQNSTAYALNNKIEFFAELTEAYFGENDYFPFVKEDLATYDTVGFNMIIKLWQLE
ncbi:MAG: hypothetical protein AAGC88_07940 [Bacteroidota bacterium]